MQSHTQETQQVYELPGDYHHAQELPGDYHHAQELPGDFPPAATSDTATDSSISLSLDSTSSSLRPAALNFSRPRFIPDGQGSSSSRERPTSYHASTSSLASDLSLSSSYPPRALDLDIHQPYVNRYSNSSRTTEQDDDYDDNSAPPPIMKTHTNSTTSIPNSSNYRHPTSATWIFKPYAASSASAASTSGHRTSTDASSLVMGNTSADVEATDDASSVAESAVDSVAESHSTGYSSISDFAFDGQLGWNPRTQGSAGAEQERERQRWQSPLVIRPLQQVTSNRSSTASSSGHGSIGTITTRTLSTQPQHTPSQDDSNASSSRVLLPTTTSASTETTSSTASTKPKMLTKKPTVPAVPARLPRIVKRTSVDQMSERVNLQDGDGMSDAGSMSSGEWKSSEFDTSGLTVAQIHKLKKKGINPALYAEMKQARKGRKIGSLTGNTFLG